MGWLSWFFSRSSTRGLPLGWWWGTPGATLQGRTEDSGLIRRCEEARQSPFASPGAGTRGRPPLPRLPLGQRAENSQLPSWPWCPHIFLVKMFVFSKLYCQRGKSHRLKEEEEEEKKNKKEEEEEKSCVYILESNLGETATFLPVEATVKPSGALRSPLAYWASSLSKLEPHPPYSNYSSGNQGPIWAGGLEFSEQNLSSRQTERFGMRQHVCVQSYLTLWGPMNCSPPGSLSMGFSRQGHWSRLSCPPPGHLPDPRIEPRSPALQVDSLPLSHPGMRQTLV